MFANFEDLRVPIVCLLGFSTCGKTTLKDHVKIQRPDYQFIESDDAARGSYATLEQIYLDLVGDDLDTDGANQEIEKNERAFLQGFQEDHISTLVCIGPSVPAREPDWTDFLNRINPICIWLKSNNVEMTAQRIIARQQTDMPTLGQSAAWGSWNNGVNMMKDPATRSFVQIDDPKQVHLNVANLMSVNFDRYQSAANVTIDVASIALGSPRYKKTVQKICIYLDGHKTVGPRTPVSGQSYYLKQGCLLVQPQKARKT